MSNERTETVRADRRNADSLLAVESLRSADLAGRATDAPPAKAKKSEEESVSLFWRVFGGTILSITALVAITLYNNLSTGISELRADLARMNEAKGDFAKKDDLSALRVQATTYASYRAEIDSLKERISKHRAELDDARKALAAALDAQKKDEAVALDGLRKDVSGLDTLKERVLTLTAELKSARDELTKVRGDLEKNQTADAERSARREAQTKQLDEAVKELAKTLQETREKLARLEGQQVPSKPTEYGPPKPPVKPKTNTPPDEG